jgi:DNA-binding PadR family transcriptional regulator
MTNIQSLHAHLPLNPSVFRILLALGSDRMHGYAIMQAIEEKTSGREKLLPGTLYQSIAKMVDDGLVEEIAPPKRASSGGPKRRYYRRTALGTQVARAESKRMKVLLDVAVADGILGA